MAVRGYGWLKELRKQFLQCRPSLNTRNIDCNLTRQRIPICDAAGRALQDMEPPQGGSVQPWPEAEHFWVRRNVVPPDSKQ